MNKIKNISQLGLPSGTLRQGTKNIDHLAPIFQRFLKYFNVPNWDDCCNEGTSTLPVSYDSDESELKFYNPITKLLVTIPTGGTGSPLTVSNFEGSIPNVTGIYIGDGLILTDDGDGNVTISGDGAATGGRFGVTGEDDTANEDRGFFLNGHFVNFNGLYTNVAIFDRNGDNIILSAMDGGATSADFIISPERISSSADIAIAESTKGFVLLSPDNNYWRITVDNFGALTTTLIP